MMLSTTMDRQAVAQASNAIVSLSIYRCPLHFIIFRALQGLLACSPRRASSFGVLWAMRDQCRFAGAVAHAKVLPFVRQEVTCLWHHKYSAGRTISLATKLSQG